MNIILILRYFKIPISNQDSFILPCKSFLYIEGKIDASTKPDNISLSRNFIPYLFDKMRIELNGITIQTVRNPGLTSTMKYYLTMDRNLASSAVQFSWFSTESVEISKKSQFNYIIPLKYLMGFFDDFKNVLINTKFELVLIRSKNEDNCHNTKVMTATGTVDTNATIEVKININKISLRMPHLFLSDIMKLEILKNVDKGLFIV